MKYQVLVRLKPGVLDVQGKAVENGLGRLGFEDISDVRIGRMIELDVDCSDEASAATRIEQICQKLLANPIIEDFEIKRQK